MRGSHLDNTVRRCVGSMNGLVGFAGATAQDVGRVEARGEAGPDSQCGLIRPGR
jgi:hypothetical protein